VVGVGHDVDLALLTVEDDAFWEGGEEGGPMKPLQLGDVPQLQVRFQCSCLFAVCLAAIDRGADETILLMSSGWTASCCVGA
jgi:hypothetical protein